MAIAGANYREGIAYSPDGAMYVTPTGNASITGGTGAFDTLSLNGLGAITSGTYTPTLTNTTNVAASTAQVCQYMRVGNVVTVSGRVDIDPTTASIATALNMSLPIASNFGASTDLGGTAVCGAVASYSAEILSDSAADNALLRFICGTDVANRSWFFTFTYRII